MTPWLMVALGFVIGVVAAQAVTVRRGSPSHLVGELSLAGRGVFSSRTPDGIWWRVRLRGRRARRLVATSPELVDVQAQLQTLQLRVGELAKAARAAPRAPD